MKTGVISKTSICHVTAAVVKPRTCSGRATCSPDSANHILKKKKKKGLFSLFVCLFCWAILIPGRISCSPGVAFACCWCLADGPDVLGLNLCSGTRMVSDVGRLG